MKPGETMIGEQPHACVCCIVVLCCGALCTVTNICMMIL